MSKPKNFIMLKKKLKWLCMTYCFEGSKNTAGCPLQIYEMYLVTVWRSQTERYMKCCFVKWGCVKLSALMKRLCTRKIKYKCDTDSWPLLDGWQRTEFSKEHIHHVQTSNQRNPNAQHTALYSHVTATAFILAMLLNKPYSALNSYFNLVTVTSLHFRYVNISLLHYE